MYHLLPTNEEFCPLTSEQKEALRLLEKRTWEQVRVRDQREAERHKEILTPPTPFTTRMKELLFTGTDFYGTPTSLLGRTITTLRSLCSDVLHAAKHDLRRMTLPDKRPRHPSFSSMEELPAIVLLSAAAIDLPDVPMQAQIDWGTLAPSSPAGAIASLDLHQGHTLYEISVSPDGTQALTSARDGTARIFDLQTGTLLHTLSGHNKPVTSAVWTTSAVLTAANDHTVRFFDPATGIQTRSLSFPGNLDWMSASSDARILALSLDDTVQIIDTETDTRTMLPNGSYRATVSPDGSTLAYLMPGNTLVVQDRSSGAILQRLPTSSRMHLLSFSPDGQKIAAGGSGDAQLFDLQSGASSSITTHTGGIWRLSFSPDNHHLLVSDSQGLITLWDIDAQGLHATSTRFQTAAPTGTAFAADQSAFFAFVQSSPSRLYAFPTPESLWIRPEETPASTSIEEEILVTDAMVESLLPSFDSSPESSTPSDTPTSSPDLLAETISALATQTQSSSAIAIQEETLALPALERQWREQERRIASLTTEITAQQANVTQAQTIANRDQSHIQTVERLLTQARNQGRRGRSRASMLERDLIFARQNASTSTQRLSEARQALTRLEETRSQAQTSKDTLEAQMDSVRSSRDSHVTAFIAASTLLGQSEDEANTTANTLITTTFQQALDALPHVRAEATILDLTLTHTDLSASWIDPIREIREHPGVVLGNSGGLVQILGRITNRGDREGPITLHITGTSDRTPNPAIQHTLTVTLAPNASRDFIATVRIPSSELRPGSVSLTTTSPDEPDGTYTKGTKEARSSENVRQSKEEREKDAMQHTAAVILKNLGGIGTSQERLQRYLESRGSVAFSLLSDLRSGTRTAPAPLVDAIAAALDAPRTEPLHATLDQSTGEETIAELRDLIVQRAEILTDVPVGDIAVKMLDPDAVLPDDATQAADLLAQKGRRALLREALHWYTPEQSALRHMFSIRTDSMVGILMAGAADRLWMAQTAQDRWMVALSVQVLTDIPAGRFIDLYNAASDTQSFAAALTGLLQEAQYAHLFQTPVSDSTPQFLVAHPDRPSYDGSADIRIRFDLAPAGSELRRLEVFDGNRFLTQTSGSTFVTVPFSSFQRSTSSQTLTLRATFNDGSVVETRTDVFAIAPNGLRATENAPNASSLNSILLFEMSDLDHFVVRGEGWRRTLASSFHLSSNHALHAMDLNKGSGAEDGNEAIYAPANAEVVRVGQDFMGNSVLILKHESIANGQTKVWYSKYLHMDKIGIFDQGNLLRSLQIGDRITDGMQIGEVGDVGSPGQVHLHLEFMEEENGSAIDARELLSSLKIPTKAYDPSSGRFEEIEVIWDADHQVWMATKLDSLGIAFVVDPASYTNGENNVWVAWNVDPAKRERVVWRSIQIEGEPEAKNRWVSIDNEARVWNGYEFQQVIPVRR